MGKCKFALVVNLQRLLTNCAFLESCGIVGLQLSLVLKTCPTIFVMKETKRRDFISKVLDMGFSLDYGMVHHALYTISCSHHETLKEKLDFLCSFDFSKSEFLSMFRRHLLCLEHPRRSSSLELNFS